MAEIARVEFDEWEELNKLCNIIEEHDKQYAGHGKNCICMDSLIRELRSILFMNRDYDARARIAYVFTMAVRRFPDA